MTRLADLSTAQIRMLARLAGQVATEDATGLEVAEMKGQDWRVAESLVALGLAEKRAGWNMTGWVTLTDKGRKVRETGEG